MPFPHNDLLYNSFVNIIDKKDGYKHEDKRSCPKYLPHCQCLALSRTWPGLAFYFGGICSLEKHRTRDIEAPWCYLIQELRSPGPAPEPPTCPSAEPGSAQGARTLCAHGGSSLTFPVHVLLLSSRMANKSIIRPGMKPSLGCCNRAAAGHMSAAGVLER